VVGYFSIICTGDSVNIKSTGSVRLHRLSLAVALALSTTAGIARAGVFTTIDFTGDTDSGINAGSVYTHALNVNVDDNVTVNGAVFTGTGRDVAAPSSNTYSIIGTDSLFHNNTNNLAGNSKLLANDFVYNGNPQVVTLNNLLIGQQYVTTFYNVGFGPAGGRVVDITTSDGGAITYDQNKAGDKNGNLLRYSFTATANSQAFTITPQNAGNTFHTYALSNRLVGYNALLTDNFYLGTNNGDPGGPTLLNSNLPARQGGTLVSGGVPVALTSTGNVQVGNAATGGIDRGNYLLTAFGGRAGLNHNFNGFDPGMTPGGPMLVSFDMAPNINAGGDTSVWGAVNVGLSKAHENASVNEAFAHFGILFRGNGQIQAFDGGSEITGSGTGLGGIGSGSTSWTTETNVTNQLHHFDLTLSDPKIGTIDVYADGALVTEFSKAGGFGDAGSNYIDFVGVGVAAFDNVAVAGVPEPTTLSLLGLGAIGLLSRRHRRTPAV
jgi:hypothetical protein